ncbi:MAG: hypothetical protein HWQ44_01075 [Nostoc sp. JL34]|uniref:hypothetical protein n=1 Tax=Nostoc sp. JL34 TaxID=2815397 RepID=UPI001D6AC03B|nr:hypothetical protein [Nostoc sp. JL34]MBN3881601.1 hypothetical protein [Nostoc sp. JL34]
MSTTGYAYALSFARHKQQAKLYNKNHEFVNENHDFVNENHDFVNENHEFVNENHDFVNENHEFVNENHDFGDDSLYIYVRRRSPHFDKLSDHRRHRSCCNLRKCVTEQPVINIAHSSAILQILLQQ